MTGPAVPRRTWSLIVTLMGDATREDGRALPTAAIHEVLAPAGVSAQAVRTALHRLRADGWIETDRRGRASLHRLSPDALAHTRAAAPRIYGPGPSDPGEWHLSPEPVGPALGGLHLGRGALPPGMPGLSGAVLRLSDGQRAALWPEPLRRALDALLARLDGAAPTPTARLLVLHDWRRIALRAPDLPDAMAPPDWRGAEARRRLAPLLSRG